MWYHFLILCRIFQAYGMENSGVNFASWMVFALPGSIICVLLAWLWLSFYFLGWRFACFSAVLGDLHAWKLSRIMFFYKMHFLKIYVVNNEFCIIYRKQTCYVHINIRVLYKILLRTVLPLKFWNIHKHFIGFNRVTPDNERIQRIRWGQMQRMTNKLNIFQCGGVIRYDVTEPLLKIQCIFSVTEYPIAIQHTPFQNVHYKSVTFFFDHRKHFLIPYKQCNTIYSR